MFGKAAARFAALRAQQEVHDEASAGLKVHRTVFPSIFFVSFVPSWWIF
jgi:hypothetical protein